MTAKWIEELARPMFSETADVEGLERARFRRAALHAFERSVPPLYRWAHLESPLLAMRVKLTIPRELPTAKSVVFMGPPAIGKTSLAVAMLRAMFERELAATSPATEDVAMRVTRKYRFVHAHRLGAARISGAEGLAEFAAATRASLLMIDDVGTDADVPSNALAEVVQERHAEERVTWFTTSFDAKELAARYGGGTARRFLEHSILFRPPCSVDR